VKKSKRGYQTQDVYNRIKRKIITLELKPGEILREKELEKDLGVGRTPIREALLLLKAENMIASNPNEAPYVTEITLKGVRDFFIPFMAIEKIVARLAAQKVIPSDMRNIKKLSDVVNKAIKMRDYLNIWSDNRKLHTLIAQASDNEYIISIHENLRNQSERLAYLAISEELQNNVTLEEHLRKMARQHQEIISSLENNDVKGTEALAEEHVKLFQRRIMMYLQSTFA